MSSVSELGKSVSVRADTGSSGSGTRNGGSGHLQQG